MKSFIVRGLTFVVIILTILVSALLFIPDPVTQENLLGALTDKHEKLETMKSPKILLVGGSNVSFGLNTKAIADSLQMPAYNVAIHAGLGLKYIIDDTFPFINSGDVVVVMPEYSHFTDETFYGNVELVSILFDVYPQGRAYISPEQWYYLGKYIPTYAASKIKNTLKPKNVADTEPVYARNSFNEYGDAYIHWTLSNQGVTPAKPFGIKPDIRKNVIDYLVQYKEKVQAKGASIYFLPPAYQGTSFDNRRQHINNIERTLKDSGLEFIAPVGRYQFADSLFFNSVSHLNRTGVNLRTQQVIEDLKPFIEGKKQQP